MKIPSLPLFLEEYKKTLQELSQIPLGGETLAFDVEEGCVYRVEKDGAPVWLLVVEKDRGYCLVSPMTFMWELATKNDLLVKFPHVLRENWIVELDLSTDIPEELLKGSIYEGKLSSEDFKTVKDALLEGTPLPKERTGRGYEDEVHREFKKLEYNRHRWLYESLLLSLDSEEEGYLEEEDYEKLLSIAQELPAASSDKNVVELSFGEVVIDRENRRALVVFKEELKGKKGELSVEFNGKKVPLFRGELHDLELKNLDEEIFKLFEYLKLEIEDEGNS